MGIAAQAGAARAQEPPKKSAARVGAFAPIQELLQQKAIEVTDEDREQNRRGSPRSAVRGAHLHSRANLRSARSALVIDRSP